MRLAVILVWLASPLDALTDARLSPAVAVEVDLQSEYTSVCTAQYHAEITSTLRTFLIAELKKTHPFLRWTADTTDAQHRMRVTLRLDADEALWIDFEIVGVSASSLDLYSSTEVSAKVPNAASDCATCGLLGDVKSKCSTYLMADAGNLFVRQLLKKVPIAAKVESPQFELLVVPLRFACLNADTATHLRAEGELPDPRGGNPLSLELMLTKPKLHRSGSLGGCVEAALAGVTRGSRQIADENERWNVIQQRPTPDARVFVEHYVKWQVKHEGKRATDTKPPEGCP